MRILAFIAALLVALVLAGVLALNTRPGMRAVEGIVAKATGDTVRIEGLSGRLPGALQAERVELRDSAGTWAEIEAVVLDWSPLALVGGSLRIGRLQAARVHLRRQPESTGTSSSGGGQLPFRLELGTVRLDRVALDPPVIGQAASLSLTLAGSRLDAKLVAGPLTGTAAGTVDFNRQTADIAVTAGAPAMTPQPGLSWKSLALQARVRGEFARPLVSGTVKADQVESAGAAVQSLTASFKSDGAQAETEASLAGFRWPGQGGDLLAAAPLVLTARVRLDSPVRPASFTLVHPLVRAEGQGRVGGDVQRAMVHVALPSLGPLAQVAGVAVEGHADLMISLSRQGGTTQVTVNGTLATDSSVIGSHGALSLSATLAGADITLDSATFSGRSLEASATGALKGGRFEGQVSAQGSYAQAPVRLSARVAQRPDRTMDVAIDKASWKSLEVHGQLALEPSGLPKAGSLTLILARLADFEGIVGAPLSGSVQGGVETAGQVVRVKLEGRALTLPGYKVQTLVLDGLIAEPANRLSLRAEGVEANGFRGQASLAGEGPRHGLALRLSGDFSRGRTYAQLAAAGTLDAPGKDLKLDRLTAAYGTDYTAKLLAPVRIAFGQGMTVDRLRLGVGPAVFDLAGRLSPSLDLALSLSNLTTAQLGLGFAPGGSLSAEARLRGTLQAPQGNVRFAAHHLQVTAAEAAAAPAADLDGRADLDGQAAQLDLHLAGGPSLTLAVTGRAPFRASDPLALRAVGQLNLALFNSMLAADGRHAQGRAGLDLAVAGSRDAPQVTGEMTLSGGDFQDYNLGLHITDITATLEAAGDSLVIRRATGWAQPGSLTVAGRVGLFAPSLPLDLTLSVHNAQPLASDLLTANLDGSVTWRGQLRQRSDLVGSIRINRAQIRIPDSFPKEVAVLQVRRPGQAPPPPVAQPAAEIGLALEIDAPQQIFVRGHGLDAEMGGRLRIGGTAAAPEVTGGFHMRHGTFDLAGHSLAFTKGEVGFNGAGIAHKLDPTLDFVAESVNSGVTARLAVTGYADAPKIALSSTPALPQDEIMAQLLFGKSVKQLTAVQIAEIAGAVASLSGGGGGFDPIAAVRGGLGLDRLSAGAGAGGKGTELEAGKYVARGVYVGARQTLSGGTKAEVQIDVTQHFKLEATVGAGGSTRTTGAVPEDYPGTSIGMSYQFDY